jgi:hypothetical protein
LYTYVSFVPVVSFKGMWCPVMLLNPEYRTNIMT